MRRSAGAAITAAQGQKGRERVARAVGARQRRSTAGRLWSAERVQTAIVLACRCCDSYGHDSSQSRRRRFKPEFGPLGLVRGAFCALRSALRAPCTHGCCGHPKRHNVTEGSGISQRPGGHERWANANPGGWASVHTGNNIRGTTSVCGLHIMQNCMETGDTSLVWSFD